MNKVYMCIDLKTFYASVECVERGLDPFKTNLVVADPERGKGTICLAVSPAMKALGVRNRCRVFEIPNDIEYITAPPRMKLYIKYSANIYATYLKYVSKEDIFVYSIDECFLDVTSYLKYYGLDEISLAKKIIKDVYDTFGITATAGIGTNLFLAKIAMDITAKHVKDNIGYLNEKLFKETVWYHEPITDIWNIGSGIAKRLKKYGVTNLYGITLLKEETLYKEFGVNAELLIDHANGIEPCTIKEIHEYVPENNSLSQGQVLFKDYNYQDALLVCKEMAELLILDLIDKGLVTSTVSVMVRYADSRKPTGGGYSLEEYTNSYQKLYDIIVKIYQVTTIKDAPIRGLMLGFGKVLPEEHKTYDFFTDSAKEEKELKMNKAIIDLKKRFGKNAILKGMNLEENATTIMRNKLVGGHNGGDIDDK